jgi:hypothetical protein
MKLQERFDIDRLMRTEARREKIETLRDEKKRKLEAESDSTERQSTSSPSTVPRKKVKLNKIDPIMLEPIGKKSQCFKFVRPNGTVVRFNIESLVDYLLSAGDFFDPETRIPFSDTDLAEIDSIVSPLGVCCAEHYVADHVALSFLVQARRAGLNKASVLDAKNNTNTFSESKFRRDALLGKHDSFPSWLHTCVKWMHCVVGVRGMHGCSD